MARKYTLSARPSFDRPRYLSGLRAMARDLPAASRTGRLWGVPCARRRRLLAAVLRGPDSSVKTAEDACWFQGAVLALQGSECPLDAAYSDHVTEGYQDGSSLLGAGVTVVLATPLQSSLQALGAISSRRLN